jgi:mannitol/fructose-specific phosphotransferase system IIA component (Ntr-type)
LFKFLDKNLINIFEREFDWKTALKLAGELLTADDFIEERYIKRMIEIVEEKGPYIAIAPHICLAHAGLEDGINKAGIGLGVFKKGFNIKHDFDPINFVFVLAPEDKKSHLPALTDIMKIANSNELLEQLLEAENKNKIYNLIQDFLND